MLPSIAMVACRCKMWQGQWAGGWMVRSFAFWWPRLFPHYVADIFAVCNTPSSVTIILLYHFKRSSPADAIKRGRWLRYHRTPLPHTVHALPCITSSMPAHASFHADGEMHELDAASDKVPISTGKLFGWKCLYVV